MIIVGAAMTLTVIDPVVSSEFFATHLGFREIVATEDVVYLGRDDTAIEIVVQRLDMEAPWAPGAGRPTGVVVTFAVIGIAAEYDRLQREGANITSPLVRLPGGEWQLQLTDPNGVVVQLTETQAPAGTDAATAQDRPSADRPGTEGSSHSALPQPRRYVSLALLLW
ncbi:VOC family protein [Nocardia sp. NPDC101769]|uniref:VOC family protein n=1 Tax=Nocardia sp. NPDC101769 TaxID=3364333 RepID=UPI003801C2C8